MGLDITAYTGLTKVEGVKCLEGEVYNQNLEVVDDDSFDFVAYINPDFPGRADDIEPRGVYKASDGFSFRAGAYSGYNRWREKLAEIAGYPKSPIEIYGQEQYRHDAGAWAATEGPFWELINFSDCDGTIGAAVSKKLAADFASFDDRAKDVDDLDFYRLFKEWRKAFDMAAVDGAVRFY